MEITSCNVVFMRTFRTAESIGCSGGKMKNDHRLEPYVDTCHHLSKIDRKDLLPGRGARTTGCRVGCCVVSHAVRRPARTYWMVSHDLQDKIHGTVDTEEGATQSTVSGETESRRMGELSHRGSRCVTITLNNRFSGIERDGHIFSYEKIYQGIIDRQTFIRVNGFSQLSDTK